MAILPLVEVPNRKENLLRPNTPNDKEKADPAKKLTQGAAGYAKYSGVAIQMIAILLLGVYAGKWLDGHFQSETPWFTLVFSILAIALALYIPLRGLMR